MRYSCQTSLKCLTNVVRHNANIHAHGRRDPAEGAEGERDQINLCLETLRQKDYRGESSLEKVSDEATEGAARQ